MAIRDAELDLVLDELRPRLVGGRIQQVRVPLPDRLAIRVRRPGRTVVVLFVVQSVHSRVHAVERLPRGRTPALDAQAPMREHLRGRIAAVERDPGERIVRVALDGGCLLAELTGRHGNLFVLDPEGTIVASLLANRSHRRDLRPGRSYRPPASRPPTPRPPRFAPPEVGEQIARHYAELERRQRVEGHAAAALRHLRVVRRRLVRKAGRQLDEASRQPEIDRLRREADLLNAQRGLLRRGAPSVTLTDLFDPGSPEVHIALDPALSPREQIDRRYRAARRLERGLRVAAEQWERTSAEIERVDAVIAAVEAAPDPDAVDGALAGIPAAWRPRSTTRRRGRPSPRSPCRCYRTPSGQRILVGRGGADNDALTFGAARGRDVWLHVVGRPGAHVVVPQDGPGPDPRALELAAQLALAHSGVAEGDVEEVAWTRVKHVRRVKGAPPGTVTYSQERILRTAWDRAALSAVDLDE